MATVELALCLISLMVVATAAMAACATMAAKISAVDTAGAIARAHAIGQDYEGIRLPGATTTVRTEGGWVIVTVQLPAVLGKAEARATYPLQDYE